MGKSRREHISTKKRPNTRGSYSSVHIKEGEILTDVTQKQWRIGKPVGAGGFGEIYLASNDISKAVPQDAMYAVKVEPHKNGPLFVEMNFYIRVAKQEMIAQWMKEKNITTLGIPHYISFGSLNYQGEKYRFLVLKRFGQDLGKVFNKCKRKFHIKTVLTLGIQILDVLEYIHSHGYIHADIKASNLLLGYGDKDRDTIYLLDYGLACHFVDKYGQHKEFNMDQRRAHDGTLEYTSRDAHVGAHSRRGDLEVLAYNMIQWLIGKLPWEDEVPDPEKVAAEKNNFMSNIPLFLKTCFGDDPPAVLHHFLKYVVSLNFDTKPDYEYCKTLLRQGIRQAGFSDDGKLNFTSPPMKLKSKKRYRDSDIENLVELKPVKLPKAATRQPCVPVQQNCNRMTRQQTAANNLTLRSKEPFDWVKVLQSDPEKLLKSQHTIHNQVKVKTKKTENKTKNITTEINLARVKENPLDNPTPAMLEVLKTKNQICSVNMGKRSRSDSSCSSPVFYEQNSLTPAMEEVIKRREMVKRMESESEFRPVVTATSTRANRLRLRNENKVAKPIPRRPSTVIKVKKTTGRMSSAEAKCSVSKRNKPRSKCPKSKLLVQERSIPNTKLMKEENTIRRSSERIQKKMEKNRKGLLTLPKYVMKKKLDFNNKKKARRREVSPSEINFIPRLRSGTDTSEDHHILRMWSSSLVRKSNILHYAAKGASPKVDRVSRVYKRPSSRRHSIVIAINKSLGCVATESGKSVKWFTTGHIKNMCILMQFE